MKKRVLLALFALLALNVQKGGTQCIGDISYLVQSPTPCFFVGTVDASNMECFDPYNFFLWKYTWKISGADDGELIATYDGMIFQHTFKKFGGYQFSLEIDKDGDPSTPPEIQEYVTYTTCEPCGGANIEFEYIECPNASCNIRLTAEMEASNAVGLLPDATFIVTYYPTSYELNGGVGSYNIEIPDIDVNYNPLTGLITVSEDLNIPYERGCFKPRLEFKLEQGAGARNQWSGLSCEYVDLLGAETFRCIACIYDGDCIASIKATELGGCEVFSCVGLRGSEEDISAPGEEAARFLVSPNPASHTLHVTLPQSERERMILLYDAFGKMVNSVPGTGHRDIDLSGMANGMYHLLVMEEGRPVFSEKVIVVK